MGTEVKHCSGADGSDFSPSGWLSGMNDCESRFEFSVHQGKLSTKRFKEH